MRRVDDLYGQAKHNLYVVGLRRVTFHICHLSEEGLYSLKHEIFSHLFCAKCYLGTSKFFPLLSHLLMKDLS